MRLKNTAFRRIVVSVYEQRCAFVVSKILTHSARVLWMVRIYAFSPNFVMIGFATAYLSAKIITGHLIVAGSA